MPFRFENLAIPDLVVVDLQAFEDNRGFFLEMYKRSAFAAHGIPDTFVQDNYSHSQKGVIRGLHYQKHPKAQAKLVMVLQGEIFDVAVDVRRDSPTYGNWTGIVLSARDYRSIYIPVGFAHGFGVLSESASVLYKVTQEYSPECEQGIIWNDPDVGVRWPIATPIVSRTDSQLPRLREANHDFKYK
jgi:dTDP-4-dehydrorhamnose 3,5-epimerase